MEIPYDNREPWRPFVIRNAMRQSDDLKRGSVERGEVSVLRRNNITLAFHRLQIGWPTAPVSDDFSALPCKAPIPTARTHNAVAYMPQANALPPQYRLRTWEAYPDPLPDETATALIELSNSSNHHQVFTTLRDSMIVGQVRLLYDVDETDPTVAEISYWLGRAFWGKGIDSDLVRLFTKRCFADTPGIMTLIARVHRENNASARVLKKCGYTLRGTDRTNPDREIFFAIAIK